MSYNPHRIPSPKNFSEEIEELLEKSGGNARVATADGKLRKVRLSGDYVDLLLAKKLFSEAGIIVE